MTLCVAPLAAAEAQAAGDTSLAGLWAAKKRFGPDLRGQLVMDRRGGGGEWRAAIAGGQSTIVRAAGDSTSFALPGGSFTGRFDAQHRAITGQWVQPATVTSGSRFATPMVLTACGRDCFAGTVVPVDDEFTFYLRVTARPDGRLAAFLRNPERNLGRFIRADRIERTGSAVRVLDAKGEELLPGVMRGGVMTLFFDDRGGSYDFRRVPPDSVSDFYPRGRPSVPYTYTPPGAHDDGWTVGTVEEVGISRTKVSEMVQALSDASNDPMNAHRLHAIAVARNGKLMGE